MTLFFSYCSIEGFTRLYFCALFEATHRTTVSDKLSFSGFGLSFCMEKLSFLFLFIFLLLASYISSNVISLRFPVS